MDTQNIQRHIDKQLQVGHFERYKTGHYTPRAPPGRKDNIGEAAIPPGFLPDM